MRIFLIQGFRLFDSSIDIVLTFEFGHYITILKMAIFDKVDYIDIEPALQYMYREQSSHSIVIIANQLGAKDYVSSILSNKML